MDMFAAKERTIFLQLTQINSSFVTKTKKWGCAQVKESTKKTGNLGLYKQQSLWTGNVFYPVHRNSQ